MHISTKLWFYVQYTTSCYSDVRMINYTKSLYIQLERENGCSEHQDAIETPILPFHLPIQYQAKVNHVKGL